MRAFVVAGVVLVALCAAAAAADVPSDARLKRDVQAVTPERALELVMALEPVTFWWSEDQIVFPQGGRHIGLVAQQVAEVLPEVVEDRGGFLYVAYDELTPLLIATTQQQQALLVAQQARLEEQQAEIDELRARLDALDAAAGDAAVE